MYHGLLFLCLLGFSTSFMWTKSRIEILFLSTCMHIPRHNSTTTYLQYIQEHVHTNIAIGASLREPHISVLVVLCCILYVCWERTLFIRPMSDVHRLIPRLSLRGLGTFHVHCICTLHCTVSWQRGTVYPT